MSHPIDPPSQKSREASLLQMESVVSVILKVGMSLSLGLVVLGTFVSLFHSGDYAHSQESLKRVTSPAAELQRSPGQIFSHLGDFRGQAIVIAGLLMLIATPILRVIVSIVAFAIQRDRFFTIITSIVLVLLLISFLLGKVG